MIASVIIQFDRQPHDFLPRETVTGTFRTVDVAPEEISRFEFSVLWFTEGKGDEDLGVQFFKSLEKLEEVKDSGDAEDVEKDENAESDPLGKPVSESGSSTGQVYLLSSEAEGQTYFFSVGLPASPLTWHGKILKIFWCVRVRLFLKSGREVMSERVFNVGKVPPVHVELN
ncbi:MAG: hypothetical protein K6C40_03445 [Thermoguttaceae bacterium]|nr:hypothetical protein [Thermoguttaceae bacterium]